MPRELPLKQWLYEEAQRQCVTPQAINARLNRGGYPRLKLRRVNARVVFVKLKC